MEKITICATKTSTEDVSAFGQEEVTPHGLSVKISTSGSSEKSIDGLTADDQLRTKSAHGFTCVLMGVPVWYGPESHKFSIEVFLGQYRSDKLKALKALDGMFGMIIVDSLSGSVDLIVDHIGSYKFFWVVTQTGFFASTLLSSLVKRIRVDGVEVNTSHCMRFLLTGISYGGESYIRSVNQTSNSELVTWNVRSKVVKTAQWWDLSFEEADKGTHKELDLLLRAEIQKLKQEAPDLALAGTGGNDSKLIAYYLLELGIDPSIVFTWCELDLPKSDPRLAKQISEACGWRHEVVKLNKEQFVRNIESWLGTSSLQSDNLGNFAIRQSEMNSYVCAGNSVMLGDEMFGPGSWYSGTEDAVRGYLKSPWPNLPRNLARVLTPDFREIFQAFYKEDIERLLPTEQSPKNVNHFLNFKLGVCGWLAAAGFYKYPYYRVLRPFLQRRVLELVSSWSERARADKVYPMLILKQFEGKFARYPGATTNSLPDWSDLIRNDPGVQKFIRSEVSDVVSGKAHLSPFFDPRELEILCTEVLTDPPGIKRGGMLAALAVSGRRWINRVPLLRTVARPIEQSVRSGRGDVDKTNNVRVILRICLLNRYLRTLSDRAT